jgi:hypothetical protein
MDLAELSIRKRVVTRPTDEATLSRCSVLYRAGGVAALITAMLIVIQLVAFALWPPPLGHGAADWFALFEQNRLLGLMSLDLLFLVDYVLLIPIILALYIALGRTEEPLMLLGTVLFLVAVAIYFASNPALEMLSLSQRHAMATTDAQRGAYLAAGESMLAHYQGTAFHASYILGSIAGIIVGMAMLRSRIFSRTSGWLVIIGNVVGFALYLPVVGIMISAFSGLILWLWYIVVGVRLLRLAGSPNALH